MNSQTAEQLIQLTNTFYQQNSTSFSNTRNYHWTGWEKLLPYFQDINKESKVNSHKAQVLDLGCGNGRFLTFLEQSLGQDFNYTGIDANQELLKTAKTIKSVNNPNFLILDILNNLDSYADQHIAEFNVITLFGVMHHIPDMEMRQNLFQNVRKMLKPKGLFVFTTWNFKTLSLFLKRLNNEQISELGFDTTQFADNDYILGWQLKPKALRYCHNYSQLEIKNLISTLKMKTIIQFLADGKDQKTNTYNILTK